MSGLESLLPSPTELVVGGIMGARRGVELMVEVEKVLEVGSEEVACLRVKVLALQDSLQAWKDEYGEDGGTGVAAKIAEADEAMAAVDIPPDAPTWAEKAARFAAGTAVVCVGGALGAVGVSDLEGAFQGAGSVASRVCAIVERIGTHSGGRGSGSGEGDVEGGVEVAWEEAVKVGGEPGGDRMRKRAFLLANRAILSSCRRVMQYARWDAAKKARGALGGAVWAVMTGRDGLSRLRDDLSILVAQCNEAREALYDALVIRENRALGEVRRHQRVGAVRGVVEGLRAEERHHEVLQVLERLEKMHEDEARGTIDVMTWEEELVGKVEGLGGARRIARKEREAAQMELEAEERRQDCLEREEAALLRAEHAASREDAVAAEKVAQQWAEEGGWWERVRVAAGRVRSAAIAEREASEKERRAAKRGDEVERKEWAAKVKNARAERVRAAVEREGAARERENAKVAAGESGDRRERESRWERERELMERERSFAKEERELARTERAARDEERKRATEERQLVLEEVIQVKEQLKRLWEEQNEAEQERVQAEEKRRRQEELEREERLKKEVREARIDADQDLAKWEERVEAAERRKKLLLARKEGGNGDDDLLAHAEASLETARAGRDVAAMSVERASEEQDWVARERKAMAAEMRAIEREKCAIRQRRLLEERGGRGMDTVLEECEKAREARKAAEAESTRVRNEFERWAMAQVWARELEEHELRRRDASLSREEGFLLEAEINATVRERDAAVLARDEEWKQAAEERVMARREREAAEAERSLEGEERAAAQAEREAMKRERELMAEEREDALAERKLVQEEIKAARKEREIAKLERELEGEERELAAIERDAAKRERIAARKERETTREERARARGERELAKAEREAAERERSAARWEREAAKRDRKLGAEEREQMRYERELARSEREAAARERLAAEGARSEDLDERRRADEERRLARVERRAAEKERLAAERMRVEFGHEREKWKEEKLLAQRERKAAAREREASEEEREAARKERIAAGGERRAAEKAREAANRAHKTLMRGLEEEWREATKQREEADLERKKATRERQEAELERKRAHDRYQCIMRALRRVEGLVGGRDEHAKVSTVEDIVGHAAVNVRFHGLGVLRMGEPIMVDRTKWKIEDEALIEIPMHELRRPERVVFVMEKDETKNVEVQLRGEDGKWIKASAFSLFEVRDERVRMIPCLDTIEDPVLVGEVSLLGEGGGGELRTLQRIPVRSDLRGSWAPLRTVKFAPLSLPSDAPVNISASVWQFFKPCGTEVPQTDIPSPQKMVFHVKSKQNCVVTKLFPPDPKPSPTTSFSLLDCREGRVGIAVDLQSFEAPKLVGFVTLGGTELTDHLDVSLSAAWAQVCRLRFKRILLESGEPSYIHASHWIFNNEHGSEVSEESLPCAPLIRVHVVKATNCVLEVESSSKSMPTTSLPPSTLKSWSPASLSSSWCISTSFTLADCRLGCVRLRGRLELPAKQPCIEGFLEVGGWIEKSIGQVSIDIDGSKWAPIDRLEFKKISIDSSSVQLGCEFSPDAWIFRGKDGGERKQQDVPNADEVVLQVLQATNCVLRHEYMDHVPSVSKSKPLHSATESHVQSRHRPLGATFVSLADCRANKVKIFPEFSVQTRPELIVRVVLPPALMQQAIEGVPVESIEKVGREDMWDMSGGGGGGEGEDMEELIGSVDSDALSKGAPPPPTIFVDNVSIPIEFAWAPVHSVSFSPLRLSDDNPHIVPASSWVFSHADGSVMPQDRIPRDIAEVIIFTPTNCTNCRIEIVEGGDGEGGAISSSGASDSPSSAAACHSSYATSVSSCESKSFSLADCRKGHVRLRAVLTSLEEPLLKGNVVEAKAGGKLLADGIVLPMVVDWVHCTPFWFPSSLRQWYRSFKLRLLAPRHQPGGIEQSEVELGEIFRLTESSGDPAADGSRAIATQVKDGIEHLRTEVDIFQRPSEDEQLRVRLEGAPGVGKSTLIKHVAQRWADNEVEWMEGYELVVLLPLNKVEGAVSRGGEFPIEAHFWAASFTEIMRDAGMKVRGSTRPFEFEEATEMFELLLRNISSRQSSILYLLDGLDEVGMEHAGVGTRGRRIIDALVQHPHYVVTSRPLSSRTLFPTVGDPCTLQGLSPNSQDAFIKWYLCEEHDAKMFLLRALSEQPNLRVLARLPVMLEIMCLVAGAPGERREEVLAGRVTPIYEAAWQELVRRWASKKVVGVAAIEDFVSEHREPSREFLCRLGFHVWKGAKVLKGHVVMRELAAALGKRNTSGGCDVGGSGEGGGGGILTVLDREMYLKELGIIQPVESGVEMEKWGEAEWKFPHLTFGEFFAAKWWGRRVGEVVRGASKDDVLRCVGVDAALWHKFRRAMEERNPIRILMLRELQVNRPHGADEELQLWVGNKGSSYMWPFLVHGLAHDDDVGVQVFAGCLCQRVAWRLAVRGSIEVISKSTLEVWARLLNELPGSGLVLGDYLPPSDELNMGDLMAGAVRMESRSLLKAILSHSRVGWGLKDGHGRTAMHIAVSESNKDLLQWMIEQPTNAARVWESSLSNVDNGCIFVLKSAWYTKHQPSFDLMATQIQTTKPELRDTDGRREGGGGGEEGGGEGCIEAERIVLREEPSKPIDEKRVLLFHDVRRLWEMEESGGEVAENVVEFLVEKVKVGDVGAVGILIAAGVDVNTHDKSGKTCLHFAVEAGHVAVLSLLLLQGADANKPDLKEGNTALHIAAKLGYVEMVGPLAASGARVNARNGEGQIPLHFAARSGHFHVIAMLRDLGADYHAKDHNNNSPLDVALENLDTIPKEYHTPILTCLGVEERGID